jgi:serine/threonine-protein kinase
MATIHLGRWIGAGGFQRTVAVKALHPVLGADKGFRDMFFDEARLAARIRHPNVVGIVDVIDDDGELYIVMEYVEGVTLAQLAGEARRLKKVIPPGIVKRIMCGVLAGLHAAHVARDEHGTPLGVIHRDVSPDNIVIGADGYARLIDFGIARALGRYAATQAGWVKGKPSYLAPEQVKGETLDHRTDIWGTSVVLWQALTGKRLFRGSSPAEIVHKILMQPITPVSALRSGIGTDLDTVVLKGLARDRRARWASAAQMAEALEATGGMASHRATGAWVEAVAAERIEKARALVAVVESTALSDDVDARVSAAPPEARVSLTLEEPNFHDEPSRTQLTSHADTTQSIETARAPRSALAIAVTALLIAVIAAGTAWRYAGREAARELEATPTTQPDASASSAPLPSSSAPHPEASAPASSVQDVGPRVLPSPKPPIPFRRWKRTDPRLPQDI